MDEPVNYHFFLHMPKTAGTSIRQLLDARFDPKRSIPTLQDMENRWGGAYPSVPELLDLPDETWRTAQILRGHYFYQVAERFPRPPVCLTMLREPVARSISNMRHLIRQAPRFRSKTLVDLIADERFMQQSIANMQTKLLSVRFDLDDRASWPKSENRAIKLNESDLERAKTTLKRFEFVGLQERFEESVAMMQGLFRWPRQARLPRSNVGGDQSQMTLDQASLDRLAEINWLDGELYRFACRLFERRLKAFRSRLSAASADA